MIIRVDRSCSALKKETSAGALDHDTRKIRNTALHWALCFLRSSRMHMSA